MLAGERRRLGHRADAAGDVPDYPKLAQLWWKNVAVAVTGEKTPQAAMDNLAKEMDDVMGRLGRAGMEHSSDWRSQGVPELPRVRGGKGDPAKNGGGAIPLCPAAQRVEGGQGPLKRMGARCDSIEVAPRPPDS